MGMSGSFGGSTTKAWSSVADFLANLPSNKQDHPDSEGEASWDQHPLDQPVDSEQEQVAVSSLASLIAEALQSDDPAIRPTHAPRATGTDSGLSYGRLVGRPRRIGTTKPPPTTGRRQIAVAIGKAGRAIGAGYALVASDSTRLAEYGLDLQTLQGLDRFGQIFAIIGVVEIENSGPDDIALRSAVVEMLDRIINPQAEAPSPEETLLELVGTYANHLLSIELDAMIQRGKVPAELVSRHRGDLADYITIRASHLDAGPARLTSPAQFEHAARELLRATLDILTAGEIA